MQACDMQMPSQERALDEPGDVHHIEERGALDLRLIGVQEPVEPVVGHVDAGL